MSIYDTIKDMALFAEFTEREKKSFAKLNHSLLELENGTVILAENEISCDIYLLIEGVCLVTKSLDKANIRLAKLKAGDLFGEMSYMSKNPRGSTVMANGKVVVLRMDQHFFDKIGLKIADKIKTHIIGLLCERLDQMNEAIMRISRLMRA